MLTAKCLYEHAKNTDVPRAVARINFKQGGNADLAKQNSNSSSYFWGGGGAEMTFIRAF